MVGAQEKLDLHESTLTILEAIHFKGPSLPEHKLLVRVTDRAVRDLAFKHGKAFQSAVDWFQSNSNEPLAFEVVCEFFGLNPLSVRRMLRNMGLLA